MTATGPMPLPSDLRETVSAHLRADMKPDQSDHDWRLRRLVEQAYLCGYQDGYQDGHRAGADEERDAVRRAPTSA